MKILKADFHQIFLALFCSVFSMLTLTNPIFAHDKNLLITPTRVILEGKTRSTVVKLINPNNKPMSYTISIVSMRMNEYGEKKYVDSPNEEEILAQKMIRFSPRRVTISPQGWQTVRLMVRKPKGLVPGEYRSQLRVAPIPANEQTKEEQAKKNISINIKYAFSISIPIIVRHGDGNVTIVSNEPILIKKNEKLFLETKLERTGIFSTFFDVAVFFTPIGQTRRMEIGSCKGMTIYAENKILLADIPVKDKDLLTKGKIEIEIRDREKRDKPLIHSNSFEVNGMTVFDK